MKTEAPAVDSKKFIKDLYESKNAETVQIKIELLSTLIEGKSFSFFACGGTITDEMKQSMLEREYLIQEGLVVPQLV